MAATLAEVHATTTDVEQRLKVEGVGQLASTPLQFTLYAGTLQDLSANRPSPCRYTWSRLRGRSTCTGPLPSPCSWGRGGGGVPDTSGFSAAVRPPRTGGPAPGALEAGGPSDAGRGCLGRTGARRNPGDQRSAGDIFVEAGAAALGAGRAFSRHIDVRDLQALGDAAGPPPPPTAATTPGEDGPPAPLMHLALTRVVDAQVHFEGQTVLMAHQTLRNVSTDLALHDGHLTLTPVFHLAGGTTRARIDVEDRGAPPHLAVRAEIAQVNVQQVFDALGLEDKAAGRVDGHMDLTASGRSLPQLVSSLAGKVAFTVKDQARHTDFHVQVATEGGAQPTPSRLRLTGQGLRPSRSTSRVA